MFLKKKKENIENAMIPGEIVWISVILHLLSSHTISSLPGQCSDMHKGKVPSNAGNSRKRSFWNNSMVKCSAVCHSTLALDATYFHKQLLVCSSLPPFQVSQPQNLMCSQNWSGNTAQNWISAGKPANGAQI